MAKGKLSCSAVFMYASVFITVLCAALCFALFYGGITRAEAVLWVGIVAFMIFFHFGGRIFMGEVSKRFKINQNHWWFREKPFERKLYELLRVKKWKGRALTFDPQAFSLKDHSLSEIAATMTKSETDHWINELISLVSVFFALIWGQWWIFLLTAAAAMIFDAQFIVIQRYNRPRVLKLLNK